MLAWHLLWSCVCPSLTSRYCMTMAKYIIRQTTPCHMIAKDRYSFLAPDLGEIRLWSPQKGAKYS